MNFLSFLIFLFRRIYPLSCLQKTLFVWLDRKVSEVASHRTNSAEEAAKVSDVASTLDTFCLIRLKSVLSSVTSDRIQSASRKTVRCWHKKMK